MSIEAIPRLEPIISSLKNLEMGHYLTSINFKRFAIRNNFENAWNNAFKYAKEQRRFVAIGMIDHNYFDSLDALTALLNKLYEDRNGSFFSFIELILQGYTEWSKKDLFIKNIIVDLELLSAPDGVLTNITNLANYYTIPVPLADVSNIAWNSEKLESSLKNMDDSIKLENYNLTLTYAYSCLEGLFKSFINERIPEKKGQTDKLNQLASIVRDYLKSVLTDNEMNYPEQILQLITTITNAISSARNQYSDSHFDKNADKSLAEFSRDCVNAIGRLILKFI